ncbi:phage baseplate assembly protein V [Pseudaestuariivita sp.]|uniref:phage baseplate assembly protein V n=1 Tax=Pseudaestuariivita sp. TaxID=2211669 RepID=UPI004059C9F0
MSRAAAEADRRIANVLQVGRVTSIDPGSATAVVDIGDLETPPIPVAQLRAGAMQTWWMPTVGEQVLIAAPSGDIAQAVLLASIYASNAPSSDPSTPEMNLGGGTMKINGTLVLTGDVIAQGISLVNHTHPHGDPAGRTGPPG